MTITEIIELGEKIRRDWIDRLFERDVELLKKKHRVIDTNALKK